MFKVVTQYSVTGEKGGYTLQWQGPNKPSYIIGPHGTCCWYKRKADAVEGARVQNEALTRGQSC